MENVPATAPASNHWKIEPIKMNNKKLHINKLSDELLEIIDNKDNFTHSDLQAIIEAFVIKNCCDMFTD